MLAVVGATAIQGITSFSLTQLLSIEGQKLIAELRRKVQEHIGRLPVTYYDSNKTGQLVSRIMSDVEGMRNLIGTGRDRVRRRNIDGCYRACFWLLRISPLMTGIALAIVLVFGFVAEQGLQDGSPHFPRARQDQRRSYRTPDRIARRRAGHQGLSRRRARGARLRGRRAAAARQRDAQSDGDVADVALSYGSDGNRRARSSCISGRTQIYAGKLTVGELVTFNAFLVFLIAPIIGIVNIGTQISEALAGLERTREVLRERPEDEDPERTRGASARLWAKCAFENVEFAYNPGRTVLHGISFDARPGTVTAFVGPPARVNRPRSG